ncbi:MotE family protein [Allorhizobium undicola]|uniref:MotE family protein n=1 Tax=Allorhizobium undicola TaxID=78527 RepID=UPI000687EACB|nr:MotE family protein [Allorhizobium undicola]
MIDERLFSRLKRNQGFVLAFGIVLLSALPGASQQVIPAGNASADDIQRFCTSIADPARDQRYLLQKQDLEKLQADVNERIATLEQRRAEYQDWLTRRDQFMHQAQAGLVDIYKNMKPDAAAPQLAKVDVMLAAAIIMKLPAKQSSLILTEMDPQQAAQVAGIMSSAADPNTSKDPS